MCRQCRRVSRRSAGVWLAYPLIPPLAGADNIDMRRKLYLEPAVVRQVGLHEVVLKGLGSTLCEHANEAVTVAVSQG